MPCAVAIGRDATGRLIKLGDVERRGGVYIVGKPRTGKSHLLVSLAIQDILNLHGLLFIDPHIDAINSILERIPAKRMDDLILLDPTHETHAFSINPLYCRNSHDLRERQLCFSQAWDVFVKAFGAADERLGILLGKYLGNCLYPFIELQGYSLYDLWDFLLHRPFREALLAKVQYYPEVIDFWHDAFDRMSPRDQRTETASLLNRLEALRRNPYIKHMISQPVPTLDFAKVLERRQIVLLRMPPWQDAESKAFIGTLVLSQLLKVIFLRTEISEHLRTPFAIMVDEFQDVATPDFAKLFTQTGKFHIMPHVAHQTRVGQLKPDDPNYGATLAAPNKVFFALATPDSAECAPEVAKDSPTETKRERILIISQNPVEDILRGHANPDVQALVTEYLRSLSHRLEDTKAQLEAERIKRQGFLDMAGIQRAFAQFLKDHPYHSVYNRDAIERVMEGTIHFLMLAHAQTRRMLNVHEAIQSLIKVLRALDSFLTAIMEGRIVKGQDAYVRSLLEIVAVFFPVSPALRTYAELSYGDPAAKRAIPFALAKRFGLFPHTIAAIEQQVVQQDRREKVGFLQKEWANYHHKVNVIAEKRAWLKSAQTHYTRRELAHWYPGWSIVSDRNFIDFLELYILTLAYPQVRELLAPYSTARFAPPWSEKHPKTLDMVASLMKALDGERERNVQTREYVREYKRRRKWAFFTGSKPPNPWYYQEERVQDSVLDDMRQFLTQYGEGALVVFALLKTIACPSGINAAGISYASTLDWARGMTQEEWTKFQCSYQGPNPRYDCERYPGYSMLNVPAVAGQAPLDVALMLENLAELTARITFWPDCAKYFWRADGKPPTQGYRHPGPYTSFYADRLGRQERLYQLLEKREDVKSLRKTLDAKARMAPLYRLAKRHCGSSSSQTSLVVNYLIARACDLARLGQEVANITFPQPTLKGVSAKEVAETIAAIIAVLDAEQAQIIKAETAPWLLAFKGNIAANVDHWLHYRTAPKPPDSLPARVLNKHEIAAVKRACLRELSGSAVLAVVHDVVRFCDLLARPENHVRVPSTQYIETKVNTYTTAEMTNQMARELMNLPQKIAYAKVVSLAPGSKPVWTGKIQTLALPKSRAHAADIGTLALEQAIRQGILKERHVIEAAIRKRQEQWKRGPDKPPPPEGNGGPEEPPPPPTHF